MTFRSIIVVAALAALAAGPVAHAEERAAQTDAIGGFYGGVALRNAGIDDGGIRLGHLASASTWGRFASPVSDDMASRALLFGGYRFGNDVAVEGSFATAESYALQPLDATAPRAYIGK